MRVALTYDLRDDYLAAGHSEEEAAEFDRPETIDGIAQALAALRHSPVRVGNLAALAARLLAGERWDLVFNIAEGLYGLARESQVPALLDAWRIPYTFSDPLVLALSLHKGMTKRVVRDGHLIAFEGEVMSTDEAVRRGLAIEAVKAPEPQAEDLTVKEIKAKLDAEGIEYPKAAKKEELLALLEADLYDDEEE